MVRTSSSPTQSRKGHREAPAAAKDEVVYVPKDVPSFFAFLKVLFWATVASILIAYVLPRVEATSFPNVMDIRSPDAFVPVQLTADADSSVQFAIILNAYNSADVIHRALAACALQRYPYWRVIVVDDASTDGTLQVVQSASVEYGMEDRLSVVVNQKHLLPSAARHVGVSHAEDWEVAVLLDADYYLSTDQALNKLNATFIEESALVVNAGFDRLSFGWKYDRVFMGEVDVANIRSQEHKDLTSAHAKAAFAYVLKGMPEEYRTNADDGAIEAGYELAEYMWILEHSHGHYAVLDEVLYVHDEKCTGSEVEDQADGESAAAVQQHLSQLGVRSALDIPTPIVKLLGL